MLDYRLRDSQRRLWTNHNYTVCNDDKLSALCRSTQSDRVDYCWECLAHGRLSIVMEIVVPDTYRISYERLPISWTQYWLYQSLSSSFTLYTHIDDRISVGKEGKLRRMSCKSAGTTDYCLNSGLQFKLLLQLQRPECSYLSRLVCLNVYYFLYIAWKNTKHNGLGCSPRSSMDECPYYLSSFHPFRSSCTKK